MLTNKKGLEAFQWTRTQKASQKLPAGRNKKQQSDSQNMERGEQQSKKEGL